MEFGWSGPAHSSNVDQVVFAENLGYSSAWFGDSQMIWSDVYAILALAATRTRSIRVGTGVAVAGTRIAPVTAAAIATVNHLSDGRAFLALARGHTAWRLMGHRPPLQIAEFEEYVQVVRQLLAGREVDYTFNGVTAPIEFEMPDHGFIDIAHRVPVYVVGGGPRTRAVAGRVGDGLVDTLPPTPDHVTIVLSQASGAADAVGRALPVDFIFASGGTVIILDSGEDLTSNRVVEQAAQAVLIRLHAVYAVSAERTGGDGPGSVPLDTLAPEMRPIWGDYCAMLARTPLRARHRRVHAGHGVFVHPDEWEFVTPAMIATSTISGARDEVLERVRAYAEAGVDVFRVSTTIGRSGYAAIEQFARVIAARL